MCNSLKSDFRTNLVMVWERLWVRWIFGNRPKLLQNRDNFIESARTGFSYELVKYQKSNKWVQWRSEISDTSPTSVKSRTKCFPCCNLFIYTYWDFCIKFCCVKECFGFYFDRSERQNEFFTCEKSHFASLIGRSKIRNAFSHGKIWCENLSICKIK